MKSTAITKAIKELIRARDAALAKAKRYAKEADDHNRELSIMRAALRTIEEPARYHEPPKPRPLMGEIQTAYRSKRPAPSKERWAALEGQALDALRGGSVPTAALATTLGLDRSATQRLMARLAEAGKVKREGWARGSKWALPRLAALIQRPKEAP